jgi:hypothetical protein
MKFSQKVRKRKHTEKCIFVHLLWLEQSIRRTTEVKCEYYAHFTFMNFEYVSFWVIDRTIDSLVNRPTFLRLFKVDIVNT